ncbi:MAG: S9 family peptidase [Caulobacter sp.]|nr:S9 family peptidase [Caulobacter sp.]
MKTILKFGAAALLLACAPIAATAAPKAPTAEEWARRPAMGGIQIAPDGKHLAGVASPDGEKTLITVWDLDNVKAGPKAIAPPPRTTFTGVQFLKHDRIIVSMSQPLEANGEKRYIGRSLIMDLDGGHVMSASGSTDQQDNVSARLVSALHKEPKFALVQLNYRGSGDLSRSGGDISRNGYYKVNVYTGEKQKVLPESDKFGDYQVDQTGEFRARQSAEFDNGKIFISQWIRDAKTQKWEEHFRSYAKDREPVTVIGFSPDPNIAYIASTKGRDKQAIYEYDISQKKVLEEVFAHKLFEAEDVIESSNVAGDFGQILGVRYGDPGHSTYWFDPAMKAAETTARQALQYKTVSMEWTDIASGEKARVSNADGASVRLADWSDDRTRFVVVRSGPNTPTEYYLMIDGKLQLLARSRPWIDSAALGDTRVVEYAARDGLQIPAFLTTPPKAVFGEGPYPTIVLPHGGPWSRDNLSWDSSGWTTYFAARGYAVLQPQFRGSEGWGQKLWRAGDNEWGQKMQDDMDDGAKWLIDQKIAAPGRIAMHGFSFGGYSAMAAAVRPNGIYKCSMAGAGVSDLAIIKTGILTNSRWGKEFQEPTIDGLDPLRHASEASIPILLYHGDYDHTVDISHSEKYYGALKAAGKDVTFVKIPGLSHSAGDTPELMVKVLNTLETYLKTGCGTGGL